MVKLPKPEPAAINPTASDFRSEKYGLLTSRTVSSRRPLPKPSKIKINYWVTS